MMNRFMSQARRPRGATACGLPAHIREKLASVGGFSSNRESGRYSVYQRRESFRLGLHFELNGNPD